MQRLCMFRVQRRTSPSQAGAAAPAGMRAALMALAPLLRSCYPLAVLGTSPPWYRSRSYRARVVGLSCSPPPPLTLGSGACLRARQSSARGLSQVSSHCMGSDHARFPHAQAPARAVAAEARTGLVRAPAVTSGDMLCVRVARCGTRAACSPSLARCCRSARPSACTIRLRTCATSCCRAARLAPRAGPRSSCRRWSRATA